MEKKNKVLYNITALSLKYSLQMFLNSCAAGTNNFFVEVNPCSLECTLESSNIAVRLCPNFPLQKGLNSKVHNVEIWGRRGPEILQNCSGTKSGASGDFFAMCVGAPSCWKTYDGVQCRESIHGFTLVLNMSK